MAHLASFISVTFLLCSLDQATSDVYHVHITTYSTSTESCTPPCLTLSEFAFNLSHYLHSNTSLVFLPGIHYLTDNLLIFNIHSFSMTSEIVTAQVVCKNYSHVHFNHSQFISLSNLEFIGCGGNQVERVEEFEIKDAKFRGTATSTTALEITETATKIVNSTFSFNRKGKFKENVVVSMGRRFLLPRRGIVGGAIIATTCKITISQSIFENNGADYGGVIFAQQHSLIVIHNSTFGINSALCGGVLFSLKSIIIIGESVFDNNKAKNEGGVLYSFESTIIINGSRFDVNTAISRSTYLSGGGGGVLYSFRSNVTIKMSKFNRNTAICKSDFIEGGGGVVFSLECIIIIETSKFDHNIATSREGGGGALCSIDSTVAVRESKFNGNSATYSRADTGGVIHSDNSTVTIMASDFYSNTAVSGGVVYSERCSNITIVASKFYNNHATSRGVIRFAISRGGVLYLNSSIITIDSTSVCYGNTAIYEGGVLFSKNSTISIVTKTIAAAYEGILNNLIDVGNNFTTNRSVTMVCTKDKISKSSFHIVNNIGRYAIIYLSDSELEVKYSGSLILLSNNVCPLVAFNSNITFTGCVEFVNNHQTKSQSSTITDNFQEGGAITLFQSNAFLNGNCSLQYNHAESGGGLFSIESKLYVNGHVTIAHNWATRNGGGVYLSNSELTCLRKSTFLLNNNHAGHKGGGIHAVSSSIKAFSAYLWKAKPYYTGAKLYFTENVAEMGGGLSLEANAKLYVLKYDYVTLTDVHTVNTTVFTANKAYLYGGAVYVDDNTNSGTCTSRPKTECFFQVLAVHGHKTFDLKLQSIYFSQNQANISGHTLHGGLLDRCAVSQFAEVNYNFKQPLEGDHDGIAYFMNISVPIYLLHYTIDDYIEGDKEVSIDTNISISSGPVKVCLCVNNEYNCSHQAHRDVNKGETFNISLVAVDQMEQPVDAIIHASLKFPQSGLSEGQLTTEIQGKCSELTFNVVSPHKHENLTLYSLDGPCKDAELSRRVIDINFLQCRCPVGFQISGKIEINCTCDCHRNISQYTEHCDSHTGSFLKISQSRAWISYVNDTSLTGYLVYPNCPYNYCLSTSPPIDLNQPNGADAQCAFNRSSLLCGSCHPDFSLSLGSSRCLRCPRHWPVQLIAITLAAILAGLALVAVLLLLNVTVAVGSLNGLIFYANIVYVNKSILFPFQGTNFITVFISWLNLDLGIDTCYFPDMDAYVKTWLQLAFPAYIITLVGLVIIVSSCSIKFSKLIGKKDPVATLATLILLSYAKILHICFESMSVGILNYPDGTSDRLWLPDATIKYLSGKHIPLFISVILILLIGLIYTTLLFSWQWLLHLPDWKLFKWTRNQKLQIFIETHHAPFTPKYRYWTGLLLIVRVILYLVVAMNVSSDPQLTLSAINFTVSFTLLLRAFFQSRVYRKSPVNVLETFFFVNLLFFSTFTWYSLSNSDINQEAIAYISVLTAIFVLFLIILYHVYTYTSLFLNIKKSRVFKMIISFLTKGVAKHHLSLPPDDDGHRFHELLDTIDHPVNNDDYRIPLLRQQPPEPTQSVVEVHQPYLPQPDTEEVDQQNVPGAVEAI